MKRASCINMLDSDARVLIVQSLVKGVFCAGADLKVGGWGSKQGSLLYMD